MSIEWRHIGQERFDHAVESLIYRRFKDAGTVTVPDGRGGDGGIDVELVTTEGKRRIFQLKYFPEGFSSGSSRSRRPQIKKSFNAAQVHEPDEWTLVVPRNLTPGERKFIESLSPGTEPPLISIIGRSVLDDWMTDDPELEEYLHRDANSTLERMARTYNQERAALLSGMSDIAARVRGLGSIVDGADPDWTVDFSRISGLEIYAIRPQHAGASARSPIGFSVETHPLGDEHAALRGHIERGFGYGTSEPIVIPCEVVKSVAFTGPGFIAGSYPPGEVRIALPPNKRSVGKPAEIKLWMDGEFAESIEGRIIHAASGPVGGSVRVSFYGDRLMVQFRLPHSDDPAKFPKAKALAPGVDISLNYGSATPDLVEKVLATARCIQTCSRVELHFAGQPAAAIAGFPGRTLENYDQDLITVEQYAYDLSVVQKHCGQFFDLPEYIRPGDRVAMRVARILIDGHLVAWPRAQHVTRELTAEDTEGPLEELLEPIAVVWRAPNPFKVKVGARELEIGDFYIVHHAATPVNAEEVITAVKAGKGNGFQIDYKPGDDPYFFVCLANVPHAEVFQKGLAEWSLIGVDQPGPNISTADGGRR